MPPNILESEKCPGIIIYRYPLRDIQRTYLKCNYFYIVGTKFGEGGFDLSKYPAVGAWLARVAAQPGYVPAGGS